MMINNNTTYYFDSGAYYHLSQSFIVNDQFSIYNFPHNHRGLIFPMLLFPFNQLAAMLWDEPLRGWWLFISVISGFFSVAFTIIFKPFGKLYYVPIPLVLLVYVWPGLFLYPLADLVSVFFLVFALALIQITYNRGGIIVLVLLSSYSLRLVVYCFTWHTIQEPSTYLPCRASYCLYFLIENYGKIEIY